MRLLKRYVGFIEFLLVFKPKGTLRFSGFNIFTSILGFFYFGT